MSLTGRWLRGASRVRADVPLALLDAVLIVTSYMVLLFVRFNGDIPTLAHYSQRLPASLPVIVAIHLAANWACGLYGQIWRHASVAEARRVVLAGLAAGTAIFAINPLRPLPMPRSVALVGAFGALGLMGLARFQARMFGRRRQANRAATPVALVGAGEAGAAIVREMLRRPDNGRTPVVVVDDNPRKQGHLLMGVPVVGDIARLDAVVREHRAQEVLVAIPSAKQELLNAIMQRAQRAGVPLRTLPPVRDLLGVTPTVRDARDVRIEDLLGRTQVPTDLARIRAAVAGRTVLITGGGGSIGSEIARQVACCAPRRLVLLDHDETHLHDARSMIDATGFGAVGPNGSPAPIGTNGTHQTGSPRLELQLADIRDRERMVDIFTETHPDLVFHAAAHKHVPLLEAHPAEAVRTNVLGTRNVVEAAAKAGVGRVVFISTDKAVRPCNNLGYSKWLGEQLLLHHMPPGARWCSVRFGNVLGSRGSVIPTFARQIAGGGPVTVTDPRMTRFFMSVSEAVQLVLQAAIMAEGGEVFMLDMGAPVNILEMAERMVRLSGHEVGSGIPVQITGVRPGEKLEEDLQDPEEQASPTAHPSIVRLRAARMPARLLWEGAGALEDLLARRCEQAIANLLAEMVASGRDGVTLTAPAACPGGEPWGVSGHADDVTGPAPEPQSPQAPQLPQERSGRWARSTT